MCASPQRPAPGANTSGDEFATLAVDAPIVLGADDEAVGMDEEAARDIVTRFLAKGGVRAVGPDGHVYIMYPRRGARSLMDSVSAVEDRPLLLEAFK